MRLSFVLVVLHHTLVDDCVCLSRLQKKMITELQTFMEKFGDMLEAAAETAIPAAPGGGGAGYGSRAATAGPREWEQWDAAPLLEFMKEEV